MPGFLRGSRLPRLRSAVGALAILAPALVVATTPGGAIAQVTGTTQSITIQTGTTGRASFGLSVTDGGRVDALNGEIRFDGALLLNPTVEPGPDQPAGYVAAGNHLSPGVFRFVLYPRSPGVPLDASRPLLIFSFDAPAGHVGPPVEVIVGSTATLAPPDPANPPLRMPAVARLVPGAGGEPDSAISLGVGGGQEVVFQPYTITVAETGTPSPTPTPSPTLSPSPTATPTATPTPTSTATPTATPAATASPSPTPVATTTPTPTPAPTSAVTNLSSRGFTSGTDAMIAGLIVEDRTGGDGTVRVLISGVGPDLANYGIEDFLVDPALAIFSGQDIVASNDSWEAGPLADAIRESGLAPADPAEAAVLLDLPPGEYTAILSGADAGAGVGLVQVFALDGSGAARLRNLSTRRFVASGDRVLIAGAIVANGPRTVVVRGLGPTLARFDVPDPLADPRIEVFQGPTSIAANDDWRESEAEIVATGLQPPDDAESALRLVLDPGPYTIVLSGAEGGRGTALVEIYDITPDPASSAP